MLVQLAIRMCRLAHARTHGLRTALAYVPYVFLAQLKQEEHECMTIYEASGHRRVALINHDTHDARTDMRWCVATSGGRTGVERERRGRLHIQIQAG